jgi:Spy/CpxP family protein refolding chaperone
MKSKLILTLAFAAGAAFAQSGPPAPKLDAVKTYLGLTDAQVTSIEAIRTSNRSAREAIFTQMRTDQKALRTALQGGNSDASTLGGYLTDIEAQKKKLTDLNASERAQALAILTDAQKVKVAALQAAAELQPTIHQASFLGLLTPPANGGDMMPFGRHGGGPGGPLGLMGMGRHPGANRSPGQ